MKSEPPIRLPRGKPNQRAILLDDALRRGTGKKVKIQNTPNEPILDQRRVGSRRREQQDIRPRRREQEHTMGRGRVGRRIEAMFEVNRMGPVDVLVDRIVVVSGPHGLDGADPAVGADVATEAKGSNGFSQAVDVGRVRESGGQLQVLVLKDERKAIESGGVVGRYDRRNGRRRERGRSGVEKRCSRRIRAPGDPECKRRR